MGKRREGEPHSAADWDTEGEQRRFKGSNAFLEYEAAKAKAETGVQAGGGSDSCVGALGLLGGAAALLSLMGGDAQKSNAAPLSEVPPSMFNIVQEVPGSAPHSSGVSNIAVIPGPTEWGNTTSHRVVQKQQKPLTVTQ